MIPQFHIGQGVYFHATAHAKSIASKGGSTIIVNLGAKGVVAGYSREGTPEESGDDFVAVKITEGDEAVGKTVWLPYSEFSKLSKV